MSSRTVVVTGAFGSLGKIVADEFEALGDKVARIDFAPSAEGSPPHHIGGVDLTDETAASVALSSVMETLGEPSVLVNVAGGFRWERLAEGSVSTWHQMFAMNAMTAVVMCKLLVPVLKRSASGSIINIGAAAAQKAGAGMGAYAASKSAVERLTESLSAELEGTSVTVNALLPTIIDTPANREDMPREDFSRWVRPEAIAKVAAFLSSRDARCIDGALIPVSRNDG